MNYSTIARWTPTALALLLLAFVICCPEQAHATTQGGTGLPWESSIQKIVSSFLDVIAPAMVLLGFVVGIWRFMAGGEINGLVSAMIVLVLSGSILMGARPFVQSLFGIGGLFG